MKRKIIALLNESIKVKKAVIASCVEDIERLAQKMISTVRSGNKVMLFGNGGSATDSMHIATELVARFQKERRPVPALELVSNISSITAIANDYNFDNIFERQIQAFGKKGDMAIGISTSGTSKNVIRALKKASTMGITTAALTGKSKRGLSEISDISINVPSTHTARVQEAHIAIGHILCELVENAL